MPPHPSWPDLGPGLHVVPLQPLLWFQAPASPVAPHAIGGRPRSLCSASALQPGRPGARSLVLPERAPRELLQGRPGANALVWVSRLRCSFVSADAGLLCGSLRTPAFSGLSVAPLRRDSRTSHARFRRLPGLRRCLPGTVSAPSAGPCGEPALRSSRFQPGRARGCVGWLPGDAACLGLSSCPTGPTGPVAGAALWRPSVRCPAGACGQGRPGGRVSAGGSEFAASARFLPGLLPGRAFLTILPPSSSSLCAFSGAPWALGLFSL